MAEQQNANEAAYEVFAGQPWFAGIYWWSWPATLPANGWNSDYKPSEDVMRSWNARLARMSGTTPPPDGVSKPAPPAAPTPPHKAKKHKKRHVAKKKHRRAKKHRRHA